MEQEETREVIRLRRSELTLADIKKKIEELQAAQQTASDEEGRSIQVQINRLETLKKVKEKSDGYRRGPTFASGSIDAMKTELSKYEKRIIHKTCRTSLYRIAG